MQQMALQVCSSKKLDTMSSGETPSPRSGTSSVYKELLGYVQAEDPISVGGHTTWERAEDTSFTNVQDLVDRIADHASKETKEAAARHRLEAMQTDATPMTKEKDEELRMLESTVTDQSVPHSSRAS